MGCGTADPTPRRPTRRRPGVNLRERRASARREQLIERTLAWLHRHSVQPGQPVLVRQATKAAWLSAMVAAQPAATGRRTKALSRFWAWQAWRRLSPRGLEVEVAPGTWLWVPPWSEIGGMIVAFGSNEPAECAFLQSMVRPGDLVVDVGANIGVVTLPLAGLGATVAAFEPAPKARSALERSVRQNGLSGSVRIFPTALCEEPTELRFAVGGDVGNHIVDGTDPPARADVVTVKGEPLDSVIANDPELFDRPVSVIKIDAEGADERVIAGATATLRRDHPVVMVESWNGGHTIRTAMAALGYAASLLDATSGRLRPLPSGWSGQANLVFTRPNDHDIAALPSASIEPHRIPAVRLERKSAFA